jgi:hypothetical protein
MDHGEMPRDDDDAGDGLRALFASSQTHVAEQPFVNDVSRRVVLARRRHTIATRTAQAVAIGALVAVSPWLVWGSAVLSTKLDRLFAQAASALDSPFGYGAGVLCCVAAALVYRRRLFG